MNKFPPHKLSTPIQLQIVSNTPGRLRLKIPSQDQEHQEIMEMATSLKSLFPQVEKVKTNLQASSITIYYSGGSESFADALSKLQALGITLVNAPAKKLQPATLTQTLSNFNQQIKQATKDTVDLRSLLSFTVIAFAIKRLLPQLARWQSTVLYLLLWYALESLVKMSDNQESPN
ncbi:HMA2 domain-containing protein [Pelatocladus sp. BLCC-F211]|uniref:HMA2 domain-containing protein n=1 Tax=Pelatocladus sp. BLCC-F211 TaxID=3342752 RepID=UPI0035BB25E0